MEDAKKAGMHYVILEVSPTATSKDIKDAFIRLSKKYHPDLNPDGQSKEETERFQMVVEAYEVLGDPIRKKEYDASLGLSRRLPFRRSKVPGESEYDEAGMNEVNDNSLQINFKKQLIPFNSFHQTTIL